MSSLKKINFLRKKITRSLTRNVGKSQLQEKIDLNNVEIKRILISRPNHRLGNLLLITPLIQELTETFPQCQIDLFIKGNLGPVLFKNYSKVNHIIALPRKPLKQLFQYQRAWLSLKTRTYDLVINGDKISSSGRLSVQLARSRYKLFGDESPDLELHSEKNQHMAKAPILNFRSFVTYKNSKSTDEPAPRLDLKLSPAEILKGRKKLKELVQNEAKTICLFTFATGEKCLSKEWWLNFYERLREEFPEYNIVEVLPMENVSQISFKAPTFYSRNLREIGSLIKSTQIFIGADSGIMHLASAAQAPTIGLFSISNEKRYYPYGNGSVSFNTQKCSQDELIAVTKRILK
ncbi:glycosyltransferase family 9 protein [Zunongwangia sp. F260]|uniref:Glycosyltransferase family 9 protein n=1 Tax=Autumnicola lenta TaxID=3075593 RepID=A0ABU3CHP6_9FLAO|nr:glycosyltransferase family 9 protein [Zunongwangia sp. F260]MDT0645873.1 glycosyltransferase family 9 protein [Zunongwangia sp. F260]